MSLLDLLEDLQFLFGDLNIPVEPQVLEKCVEICTTYNISPEDLIDQWLAYTTSYLNGSPPTLHDLDKMERKELKRQSKSVTTTPHSHVKNIEKTPIRSPVRQNLQNQMIEESPMVIDEVGNPEEHISHNIPSESFAKRTDAGAVLQSFGECDSNTFKHHSNESISVKIQNEMTAKTTYMYEKFLSKRAVLNSMTKIVISAILKKYELELTREKLKEYSGQMVICGRICSELHEKLDQGTIQLEGLIDLYKGHKVNISTSQMEKVRLFSGQSVVVRGNNMKDYFVAKEIITGIPIPPSPEPEDLKETLQIIVAAGPFTVQENLLYEPLDHLLKLVAESKPNLLILLGPFMDSMSPHFDTLEDSYDSFFENMVDGIMHRLKNSGVKVVLVPSHKDVHHHPVFPTLPFKVRKRHENLYLAPNPFVLDINGFIIGGSTADILFHLGKLETSKGTFEDRVGHLASHIFAQRSFYTLHPPDNDIRVDYQLVQKYGMIQNAPHVMIFPSNFKHFIKNGVESATKNCIIVNPERLTKGSGGGTFAKMEIRSAPPTKNVHERISCIIQRI